MRVKDFNKMPSEDANSLSVQPGSIDWDEEVAKLMDSQVEKDDETLSAPPSAPTVNAPAKKKKSNGPAFVVELAILKENPDFKGSLLPVRGQGKGGRPEVVTKDELWTPPTESEAAEEEVELSSPAGGSMADRAAPQQPANNSVADDNDDDDDPEPWVFGGSSDASSPSATQADKEKSEHDRKFEEHLAKIRREPKPMTTPRVGQVEQEQDDGAVDDLIADMDSFDESDLLDGDYELETPEAKQQVAEPEMETPSEVVTEPDLASAEPAAETQDDEGDVDITGSFLDDFDMDDLSELSDLVDEDAEVEAKAAATEEDETEAFKQNAMKELRELGLM